MNDPKIQVGQIWERHDDGTLVEVVHFDAAFDDVSWRTPDKARRGQCYAFNFRQRYALVVDA